MADVDQLRKGVLENALSAQSVTNKDGSVTSQNLMDQERIRQTMMAEAAIASGGAFAALRPRRSIAPGSIGNIQGRGP